MFQLNLFSKNRRPFIKYSIHTYCAVSITTSMLMLTGCASPTATELLQRDPLSPQNLQIHAQSISIASSTQANDIILNSKQRESDVEHLYTQQIKDCQSVFFINRCIQKAREAYHKNLDNILLDTASAQLYIRHIKAEQQRQQLLDKAIQFQKQERQLAPQRRQNALAYAARQKALQAKITQHKKQQQLLAPSRAAKALSFSEKLKKIEAIKAQRLKNNP